MAQPLGLTMRSHDHSIDIMKIGGVAGWISAAGQAETASLPLSSHTFIEASARTIASSPAASWFSISTWPGPSLPSLGVEQWQNRSPRTRPWSPNGTRRFTTMHLNDVGSESQFRSETLSAQLFGLDGVPQGSCFWWWRGARTPGRGFLVDQAVTTAGRHPTSDISSSTTSRSAAGTPSS